MKHTYTAPFPSWKHFWYLSCWVTTVLVTPDLLRIAGVSVHWHSQPGLSRSALPSLLQFKCSNVDQFWFLSQAQCLGHQWQMWVGECSVMAVGSTTTACVCLCVCFETSRESISLWVLVWTKARLAGNANKAPRDVQTTCTRRLTHTHALTQMYTLQ